MPHGYREGRNTPWLAGFVLVMAMTAGCHRFPVHPPGPASFAESSTPHPQVFPGPSEATLGGPARFELSTSRPDAGEPVLELPGPSSASPVLESASAHVSVPPRPSSSPTAEPVSDTTACPIPRPTTEPAVVADDADEAGPPALPLTPTVPEPEKPAISDPREPPAGRTAGAAAPGKSTDGPSPRDDWRDGIEGLRAIVRGHSGEADGVWPLRALILDALARAGERGEDANLLKAVLPALGTDEPRAPAARPRLDELHAAILALEDQVPLEITHLQFCRKVGGFGNFDPLDPTSLKAGQSLIIYCELSGLRSEPTADGYLSRLASRYEIIRTAGGRPVVVRSPLGAAEDHCRRRRRDYYANYRVDLPDTLPPGSYELRLTQEDAIAGRSTSSVIPFSILP